MFKKVKGSPDKKRKHCIKCKIKECENKSRPPDEIEALREEVKDLWEIVKYLTE